ncbi:class I SAM-dependent methyltransferase [Candidatus Pelagibacter sp. Uisw_099_02]|jgi:ubiquinone/menaquinone biosynthesis C-methylase UbiE|uniref:class I SAM-dependent methyltransferase n=1 Tax=Candidatus Pelagibacter sp. Uisw_099_02 TaxID=3230981 RepID=UPI00236FDC4C|nr:class I SAM-dependent methyltransferase [Candidatus Pelagibacter sp.]|tara:strand:+ start:129 stop:779 length:651 start_codon:yes stop_codon:yes gene_type:complete
MLKNYSNPDYKSREGRNAYCIKLIDEFFSDTKTILNLGGGGSRYFKDTKYKVTEVDQSGDNNITLDLDNVEKIPFESNSFDTVICLDVLEHLENFHLILDEMNRVSEKYIIISLPNCVHAFFEILFDKRSKNQFENGYYNKFYGLPLNKPSDRHRWFFTISDIENFFEYYSKKNNLKVEFILPKINSIKSKILNIFLKKRLKKEILTKYAWIIIRK